MKQKIRKAGWEFVANEMHEKGFAIIPNILTDEECSELPFWIGRIQVFQLSVARAYSANQN